MTNRWALLSILLITGSFTVSGQSSWELKSDKEGIFTYTRTLPDSKFKAIRVVCEINATLSQLVAVIMDVNATTQWVFSTKSAVLLKQVSPSELYYYSEVNVPWPASNRDFIARLKVDQDPVSKVVTVYGPTYPDYLPVKKDIVRVAHSEGKWIITPAGAGKIRIEYVLTMDPGGNIPAWLVNMFATKGPYESFKKLKVQLGKPAYAHVHYDFIRD